MDTLKNHWIALKRRNTNVVTLLKSDKTTIEIGVVFKEYSNGNLSIDDKILFCDIGLLHQGDIVEYNQIKYIIIQEQQNYNNIYTQFVCRRLDNIIKIYIDNKLEKIPTYIETSQQGIENGQYIITGKGNIKLTIQDNNITKNIKEDMRIIKWGYGWKVIAKTQENEGLKYIYMEKDQYNNEYDDMENEIADRWKHEIQHQYSIEDIKDISINKGDTKQLDIIVQDTIDSQTTTIENPTLIYSSSDISVCKISDTGLITAINEGNATITIQFQNIIKTINVIIAEVEQIQITGLSELKWNRETTYTVNNATKVTWTLKNEKDDNTNLAKIISTTDNTCTIKANCDYNMGYVILGCIDTEGNKSNFRIKIKSIY